MLDSESVGGGGPTVPSKGTEDAARWGGQKRKRRGSSSSSCSSPLNGSSGWGGALLAALCLFSLGASGYFGYRESVLEARLAELERRFQEAGLQGPQGLQGYRTLQYPDVIVERVRRDVEQRIARRLPRAAPRDTSRIYARSAGDCNCPPGRARRRRPALGCLRRDPRVQPSAMSVLLALALGEGGEGGGTM